MNERQCRQLQQFRDDQTVLRAAAERVRQIGRHGGIAGLDSLATTTQLASILDVFADRLDHLDPEVRHHACRVASELVGHGMDRPAVRRTRRR